MIRTLRSLTAALSLMALLAACAASPDIRNELVVLLPDKDGTVGVVSIETTAGSELVLDTALASAQIGAAGGAISDASQDQVQAIFSEALAAQPPDPISFTLYFKTGGTELREASKPVLKALFETVAARQAVEVQVTGHTDLKGSIRGNDKLALKRAEAVAAMLIDQGIQTTRVRAVGRGEREPLVPTADGVAEAKNRRVEIIVR